MIKCVSTFFSQVSSQDPAGSRAPCRSVLLFSERNGCHVIGVLRYLERTDALLPPYLRSFAQGVHEARESQKTDRPLCSYLKSCGVCRSAATVRDTLNIHGYQSQRQGIAEVLSR